MPNIYDGISGEKMIEEINNAIDSRGKIQEDGSYGGAQTINSDLNIAGGLNVLEGKSLISELYKTENNKYIDELQIKNSDINIQRDQDGKILFNSKTYTIEDSFYGQTYPVSQKIKIEKNLNFTFSNIPINENPTRFDGIYLLDSNYKESYLYVYVTTDWRSASVQVTGTIILKKDGNEILKEEVNQTSNDYSYSHNITIIPSNRFPIELTNVNGEYELDIDIEITSNSPSDLDRAYLRNDAGCKFQAKTAKRII